ncbi:UNVERIFIED_CONTAM: ABC-2 type transport system ATP-binding protein [Acetivibrio alkalicellulosi]
MKYLVEANNLEKKFGNQVVLDKLNIEAAGGKIIGLLGPNGSGKTVFFNMLTGFIQPDDGQIIICGDKLKPQTKEKIAYMPDENHLYSWMKVKDVIAFYSEFFSDFDIKLATDRIISMGIDIDKKVKSLSKGSIEKLRVSLVFSRNASVYIIDEPLLNIDLLGRDKIIQMTLDTINEQSTMIITTQLIGEIERIFDEVYFIDKGKIILKGECDHLRSNRGMSIENIYREVFSNEKFDEI